MARSQPLTEAQLVELDQLEEQGHWPLGAAAAALPCDPVGCWWRFDPDSGEVSADGWGTDTLHFHCDFDLHDGGGGREPGARAESAWEANPDGDGGTHWRHIYEPYGDS